MNETQLEEAEEEHGITKISENKCKKVDFEDELTKEIHLNTKEKKTYGNLEKSMKIYLN